MCTKKLGIVVTDTCDWTADALMKEARRKGFESYYIDLGKVETCIGKNIEHRFRDMDLSELDAIIVRDMGSGKNDAHVFRFDVLQELERNGVIVINPPSAIQNAANKFHASCLIADAGIPTPVTFVSQRTEAALDKIEELGDVVVKPFFGYKGIGIWRVKNGRVISPDGKEERTSVHDLVEKLMQQKGIIYIQEFIENPGRDIRAFIIDGNVKGAIYRKASSGWWLNNLSQGGTAQACELTDEQRRMCVDASRATGAVFAGVDMIENDNVCHVLEVNATPSGAGIYKSLKVNVAEDIIATVDNKIKMRGTRDQDDGI